MHRIWYRAALNCILHSECIIRVCHVLRKAEPRFSDVLYRKLTQCITMNSTELHLGSHAIRNPR